MPHFKLQLVYQEEIGQDKIYTGLIDRQYLENNIDLTLRPNNGQYICADQNL
jgi:hypothetical protein